MNFDILAKIIFLFILAVLPSLIWLSFFLRKDPRPEPRRYLLLTFVLGGLMVIPGVFAENNWLVSFVQNNANIFVGSILFVVLYAFLEEILKFFAGLLGSIKNKYFLDEKSDPMVYMIVAGLGFATAENIRILFLMVSRDGSIGGLLDSGLTQMLLFSLVITALIRFVSTILLHALSSSIIGYFWAMLRLSKNKIKMGLIALPTGFILATILHSLFNYLAMNALNDLIYVIFLTILLIISSLIVKKMFFYLTKFTEKEF